MSDGAIVFPQTTPKTVTKKIFKQRMIAGFESPTKSNPSDTFACFFFSSWLVLPFRFLWGTYRPAVYWYECWECVRKLLLTGLLVYFKEGTPTQVID